MSETRYLAVAFASRVANGHLRPAVTEAAPAGAKVVRTRPDVVAAVYEVAEDVDARIEGERLRRIVAEAAGDPELTVAVSGPKRGSTGAHLALLQAEQAVAVERGNGGTGRTTHFEDIGPFRYVLGQPESDIEAQAERALGALAEDEERYADLIKTLEAFIRLHGSVNAVARDLFLHRNTVRQRLRRIAQLTGQDLTDPNDRLALQLALIGREALQHLS
ncbi:MAG TPA: helix-turn-helix domain-containing protein [Candidatus Limnocylindria bacterium]|nr:helix-turn-helix domain-containing protein [Candidatus Limnocylindria bacterium]